MKIEIRVIPHGKQRYSTCGDYWIDKKGVWQIRVSKMNDPRSEQAVAIHELSEMSGVIQANIPMPDIDAFDLMFEEERGRGLHGLNDEPGDDPRCPYHKQHVVATAIEVLQCDLLNLPWSEHEANVNKLFE